MVVASYPMRWWFPVSRGFLWVGASSLWICQSIHEIIAERVQAVQPDRRFVDRQPAPPMVPLAHTEYLDNFIAVGQKRGPVYAVTCQVEHALMSVGLLTHPVEISAGGTNLGWTFKEDFPIVGVNPRTAWGIRLALRQVLADESWVPDACVCVASRAA
eukprot:10685030-Heterocapsa_arctica.AAC.1